MKNDEDKNKPSAEVETPTPPQFMDPNERREAEAAGPEGAHKRDEDQANTSKPKKEEKPKLLGETETQIDDETTI